VGAKIIVNLKNDFHLTKNDFHLTKNVCRLPVSWPGSGRSVPDSNQNDRLPANVCRIPAQMARFYPLSPKSGQPRFRRNCPDSSLYRQNPTTVTEILLVNITDDF
jgi:hypothetical protein